MLTILILPSSGLSEMFPFWLGVRLGIHTHVVAGIVLWALALYLGLFPVAEWLMDQLLRWFNFAERSLYLSQREFDQTRTVRETINGVYASLFSVVPFLVVGLGCQFWIAHQVGAQWSLSLGIAACIGGGMYELGRRDGHPSP